MKFKYIEGKCYLVANDNTSQDNIIKTKCNIKGWWKVQYLETNGKFLDKVQTCWKVLKITW